MPYPITRNGNKYCVNGKCYDTEEEARQYQKALYANVPDAKKSFEVFKSGTEYRWKGHPTVNVRDREWELVSARATTEVVARSKAQGFYPPLQFDHIDYNVGETEWYGVVDGILCASGRFNDDAVSRQVAKYYLEHPEGTDGTGWAMSWRFFANPDANGVYRHISRIKEFTFLPYSRASNQETSFEVEVRKMLTDEQRKAMETVLGDPALLAAVETALEAKKKSAELNDAGVERKSVDEPAADATTEAVAKDTPVAAPAAGATQTMHGPEGLLNQPGVEQDKAAGKCANCDHPAHPGKPCGVKGCSCGAKDDEAAEGEKAVADDLSDKVAGEIAKFAHDEAVEQARVMRAEIEAEVAKEVNAALNSLVAVVKDLQERLDILEGQEKAMDDTFVKPRNTTLYERMKSATASASTKIEATDPLAAGVATQTVEAKIDAEEKDVPGIFHAAGLAK